MKVPEARVKRLSEGLCPACIEPLARGREEGICNCCGFAWRLRDSEVKVCVEGVWLPGVEGPQGCINASSFEIDGVGTMSVARMHTFHLDAAGVSIQSQSTEGQS